MIVYRVHHNTLQGGSVAWLTVQNAIEEIKMHLLEGEKGDRISVEITEMSEETYKKLPEFRGY